MRRGCCRRTQGELEVHNLTYERGPRDSVDFRQAAKALRKKRIVTLAGAVLPVVLRGAERLSKEQQKQIEVRATSTCVTGLCVTDLCDRLVSRPQLV